MEISLALNIQKVDVVTDTDDRVTTIALPELCSGKKKRSADFRWTPWNFETLANMVLKWSITDIHTNKLKMLPKTWWPKGQWTLETHLHTLSTAYESWSPPLNLHNLYSSLIPKRYSVRFGIPAVNRYTVYLFTESFSVTGWAKKDSNLWLSIPTKPKTKSSSSSSSAAAISTSTKPKTH